MKLSERIRWLYNTDQGLAPGGGMAPRQIPRSEEEIEIVLSEIADEVEKLEGENERLWKFFHAGGDHDWSCQSTHGTGLSCDCGFQEVLDTLLADTKESENNKCAEPTDNAEVLHTQESE